MQSINKPKLSFIEQAIAIMFFLIFAFRGYADSFYNSRGIENQIVNLLKYIVLVLSIFTMVVYILKKNKQAAFCGIFKTQYKSLLIMLAVFLGISLVRMAIVGKFYLLLFKGLLYIFIPITYAFLLVHVMDNKNIYKCLVAILYISIFFYFIEGVKIDSITGYKTFTWIHESGYFCGTSCGLAIYFSLVKEDKLAIAVSQIFNFMTLKRPLIVVGIVALIISAIPKLKRQPPKKVVIISVLFFAISTIVYFFILAKFYPSELLHGFTTGRNKYLNDLLTSEYISYGYYSSVDFYRNIEMDLVRILIETGVIGLFTYVYTYLNIGKESFYSLIIMSLLMCVLLFTDAINNSFVWIIYYLVIAYPIKQKNEKRRDLYELFDFYSSSNL